jgi:histidine triad (HIT) family protein
MENCIFCKIVKGEIPSEKIYEDEMVLAFLDAGPVNLGHTLVVPKKHFENIYDLEENTLAHLMKIVKKISIALKKFGADGVNITMNNDRAAGQVVFHSHIHIIPRLVGDNLPPWPARKPKEGEMKGVAKKIISMLARP